VGLACGVDGGEFGHIFFPPSAISHASLSLRMITAPLSVVQKYGFFFERQ
jgi:hypothetical protein